MYPEASSTADRNQVHLIQKSWRTDSLRDFVNVSFYFHFNFMLLFHLKYKKRQTVFL